MIIHNQFSDNAVNIVPEVDVYGLNYDPNEFSDNAGSTVYLKRVVNLLVMFMHGSIVI